MPTKHRYIALLRAINVGGTSIITMADLKKRFESFGVSDVSTYIQTGNVIFSSDETDAGRLESGLERQFTAFMGREMKLFVRSPDELREAAEHNPFEPEKLDELQQCVLVFLSVPPKPERIEALMQLEGSEYHFYVHDRVFYYTYLRINSMNRRRSLPFEKILGVQGTSRTWKVVNRLIELAGSMN